MSRYAEGQTHQLADALEEIGFTANNLTVLGQNKNGVLCDLLGVLHGTHEIVRKSAKTIKSVIRRLTRTIKAGVMLVATTGREVEQAQAVFNGYCDPNFLGGKDMPTEEVTTDVEEMVEDGTYRQIFDGCGRSLRRLLFTRSQIMKFCLDHRAELRGEGYGNFFLYKMGKSFFVADVRVLDGGRLSVFVDPLEYDDVWYAGYRHRIIVP